jgi:hypothetical protein
MSMIDAKLVFGEGLALASAAAGENIIDTGVVNAKLSGNRHGAGYLNIHISTAVAGTSCSVKLQDCATAAGSYTDLPGTSVVLTSAAKGAQFSVKIPKSKRFLKLVITSSSITAGKADVFVGPALAEH